MIDFPRTVTSYLSIIFTRYFFATILTTALGLVVHVIDSVIIKPHFSYTYHTSLP